MDRAKIILAALAPANRKIHTPVQVQKLLFLIDREISDLIEGPYFNFQPYNYGPFDKSVYDELDELSYKGLVDIVYEKTWKNYMLTELGQELGDKILKSLSPEAIDYIKRASNFIRSISFSQLIQAIYKAYPEMRENSVFQN